MSLPLNNLPDEILEQVNMIRTNCIQDHLHDEIMIKWIYCWKNLKSDPTSCIISSIHDYVTVQNVYFVQYIFPRNRTSSDLPWNLSFGILLNIYLSQLVRVCGKYIFSHFCDFQTLDPWFPLKYTPVSTPSSLNMPFTHPFLLLYRIQGHKRYRGLVLTKVHIVQCGGCYPIFCGSNIKTMIIVDV